MNRILVCAGLIAMAGTAFASEEPYDTMGNVINVASGESIQDAIDSAMPGDTIMVAAGTYAPFTVDVDGLTILGADVKPEEREAPEGFDFKVNKKLDQDNTRPACEDLVTIDGEGEMGSLVSAQGVEICGFCFVNGKDSHDNGGALKVTGSATVSYSWFADNKADEDGGAIFVGDGASLSVSNSSFMNNEAEFGGAIHAGVGATLNITDVDFIGNSSTGAGGAIDLLAAASVNIEAAHFEGNSAERTILAEGGALYNFLSPVTIKNSVFCGNRAVQGGAAIFSQDGDNDIWFSTFWNNTSLSGGGLEQNASPSTDSEPVSKFDFWNCIIIDTRLVNNVRGILDGNGGEATRMEVRYSFVDQDLSEAPRVRNEGGNLGLDDLPEETTTADLFVDAANCDFRLVCTDCYRNPVIDAGDSRECEDLCFDKDDNGRAIDKVDNPSSAFMDEGMENTGVDIWRRNHTCDAVDMGAFEFKQAPFAVISETCKGDVDGDLDVDLDDIFEVLRKFGYPCVIDMGCEDVETDGGATGNHR